MTKQPVRMVAFANGNYSQAAKLQQSVPNARKLAQVLEEKHQYEAVVFSDMDHNGLQSAVTQKLGDGTLSGGTLILSWTGHGVVKNGELRLLGNFQEKDTVLATAAQLGEWAAQTGAFQILLVLDTCSAGAGVIDAADLARSVIEQQYARNSAWFGVIAASLADEPALSGALSRELQRLLENGPRNPDIRWDRKREYIRGDDLIQALRDDWDESRQTPQILATSSKAWDLVRNPLFEPGLPDQVVEHLLQAARGHSGEENFFTGRHSALRRIVSWIGCRKPGLFVVTGPPGAGKSAVVGRIVSLSSKEERGRILHFGTVPEDLDPLEGSVDAHVQARGITIDVAAEEMLRRLGLDPADGRFGLLSAAARRRKAGDPLLIVVDGLDEAGSLGREMAAEFLKPLAQECLLLVSTRDVLKGGQESLIATLGPAAEYLDLGSEDSTCADVHAYVSRRLHNASAQLDPARVAAEIVSSSAAPPSFLLARLVTSQLREKPVNTSVAGWQMELATTVESALERDVQSVVLDIEGQPSPAAAREMLRALTLAYGSGFPADDVWPVVATAISETGVTYTRDHAFKTLAVLGRHLVSGSESGQPVYRLAHQKLVDYLSADTAGGPNPEIQKIRRRQAAAAIAALYNKYLDDNKPESHQYLWRYGWRHLAEGGDDGLQFLRHLADRNPEAFLPDLASGLELASSSAFSDGLVSVAADYQAEAVRIWRDLQRTSQLSLGLYQLAMICLTKGDQDGADAAATEASSVAGQLPESSERRRMAALTLIGRALVQLAQGGYKGARLLTEKASALGSAGEQADQSNDWQLQATASLIAAKASLGLADGSAALSLCQRSIDLVEQYGDPETDLIFTDALATLVAVRVTLSVRNELLDDNGNLMPASCEAGARLAEGQARWSGNNLRRMDVNRGLFSVVQALLIDESRAVDVSHLHLPDAASIPALLNQIIDDAVPFAGSLLEAAFTCGCVLNLRAALRPAGEQDLAALDRSKAIAILKVFSKTSPVIAGTLGAMIFNSVSESLSNLPAGAAPELDELAGRQQESISLLRSGGALFAPMFAQAVMRSPALWQIAGRTQMQEATTAAAVAEMRSLVGQVPEAPFLLAALLADLSGLNVEFPVFCAEFANEAMELAKSLPSSPAVDSILALSQINLATAKTAFRKFDDVAALLQDAIRLLEPQSDKPINARLLGVAYTSVAAVNVREGHFELALGLARTAVRYLEAPGEFSFIGQDSRALARFYEGRALQHLGQTEKGSALVSQVIDHALNDYCAELSGPSRLAGILNESEGEIWDKVLARLSDRPSLMRRLKIQRTRPISEIHLTVGTLLTELAVVDTSEIVKVRAVARFHRLLDQTSFDAAWQQVTGEMPGWLQLDLRLIGSAVVWLNCNSWVTSRNYLEAHPDLLNPATGAVLEELRFNGVDGKVVDQHLQILSQARATGVKAAYAPLLAAEAVQRWVQSEKPLEYLNEHPELLNIDSANYVNQRAEQNEDGFGLIAAVLELAKRDELGLVTEIDRDPNSAFKFLLPALRSKDVTRLVALARLLRGSELNESFKRKSTAALAVARVLESRDADAKLLVAEAVEGCSADDREDIIGMLGEAISHHQSFAAPLAALIQITPDGRTNSATGTGL